MLTLSTLPQFFRPDRSSRRWRTSGLTPALAALLLLLASPALGEKVENLRPHGYVNDFAGALDSRTVAQLTAICQEVDQKAQAQIAVVTVRTIEGLAAQDFATRLNERWKVGYKGTDRGIIILLAVADHQYWFEVGYGLEPILPDGKVGGFGREMVPLLRRGDANSAVLLATSRVAEVIARERGIHLDSLGSALPDSAPATEPGPASSRYSGSFVILLIVILLLRMFFSGILGGGLMGRGGWYGGGFGGGGYGGGGGGGGFGGFGGGSSGGGGAGGSW